ncbi:MAG: right-handed parallel beta-helix repeat-containing protein, partial [Archaeoglobaceae archaeon]|nr:right-handed parallel beta-helix repeat-containing protein [Archaeoglobaceae archaeon]
MQPYLFLKMRRIVLVSLLLILCLAIAGAKTCTSDSTKMSNAMLNTKTHPDESKGQNIGVNVLESKNTINFEAKKTNVKTWHVDDNKKEYPNAEYANIQDAINAASDGDVIIVYAGIYSPFVVNKSLNITGISVIKNKVLFTPKIVGKSGEKIEIAKDNCIISGLLTNTSINVNSSNNLIANNIIVGKNASINVYKKNNTIVDNVFIENFVSIRLLSDENLVRLNTIKNSDYGIGIKNANKNLIFLNEFINNNVSIPLLNSNDNEIARNIIFHSNVLGIHLNGSSKNLIVENTFANCTGWALRVFEGNKNLIAGNRFENNTITIVNKVAAGFNIFIMNSTSNTILSNIIKGVIPNTVGI